MTKFDVKLFTDHALLICCGYDAVTAHAKKEIRARYNKDGTAKIAPRVIKIDKIDEGTFFVANHGAIEGVWACKKDGQTSRAVTHGSFWEKYKIDHPNWHMKGRE